MENADHPDTNKKDESSKPDIKTEDKSKVEKEDKPDIKTEDKSKVEKEDKPDIKTEDKSKVEKEDKYNNRELENFNKLVKKNKASGRHWYYGLEGKWWWGMSEEKVRRVLEYRHRHPKIIIASIVRNEEHNDNIIRFLNCCSQLEKYHNNIVYIFIEGDSSDNTYEVLQDWLKPRKDYILKKLDRQKPLFHKTKSPVRTAYFAELRNMLVDLILSIPGASEILMIDANYGWQGDLISSLRDINADIAAPLVVMHKDRTGKYLFYDTWAFRKDGKQFAKSYPYIEGLEYDKPMKIDSAGGGYLIRRRVLEAGIKYNGDKDCEHVSFCRRARKKGFTIKIDPKSYIRKGGFKDE